MSQISAIVEGRQLYPAKEKQLWLPELEVVATALEKELGRHYKEAKVNVITCPDLRTWGCAAEGLGGNPILIEGGGEPFNHDQDYNQEVHFRLDRMAQEAGYGEGAYIQGAAAACGAQLEGHLGELVPCLRVGGENMSKACRVETGTRDAVVQEDATAMCGGISNLYVCKGEKDKVLEIKVSGRMGDQASLTQVMRGGLASIAGVGGHKQIGLGGVFRMEAGSVKAHINPDMELLPQDYYDPCQMKCVKDFLQFYQFSAPLLCFSCLWTGEPEDGGPTLNLRGSGEHTHFWREKKEGGFDTTAGGHYHGDTTPEEVIYHGYFSPAAKILRLWDAVQQRQEDNARSGAGAE